MAEPADAALSNSAAERRGGSTPSTRTDAAQWLHDWNKSIFEDAKRKREEEFDKLLAQRAPIRSSKDVRDVSGKQGALWDE